MHPVKFSTSPLALWVCVHRCNASFISFSCRLRTSSLTSLSRVLRRSLRAARQQGRQQQWMGRRTPKFLLWTRLTQSWRRSGRGLRRVVAVQCGGGDRHWESFHGHVCLNHGAGQVWFGYCVSWQYNARGGGVEGDWEFSCFFVKNYTPNQGRVDQSSGYGGMAVWQGHRVAMSNGPAVP